MLHITVAFLLVQLVTAQNPSPCPNILTYEPRGLEQDRYYARLSIPGDKPLSGIWLRIILDQPAQLVGNWFGDASTENNKDFLIKNREYQFDPVQGPFKLRFFVKHDLEGLIPSVIGIRLNGNTVCPESVQATTQPPTLFISHQKTTESGAISNRQSSTDKTPIIDRGNSDDDFFAGDFAASRRPILPVLASGDVQEDICGTVKIPARPLITFGQNTVEGEWPWHAALYRTKDIGLQYICGGSLISLNHVLTAAHCVTKPKSGLPTNPDLFSVYLGKFNLYRLGPSVQNKGITKISTHPEFNGTYLHNDIAILHLDSAVKITDFVRTVCLWEDDVSLNSVTEKLGTVVGWGFDQNGNVTENLMQAKMPVVSTETCIFSNRDFFSRFTSTKTFCAGFRNGTSACTGDSGGGMVFPKTSSDQNKIWQLRGVISLSAALQSEKVVCDTSNYIVFTDVAKHLDWIRDAMKS